MQSDIGKTVPSGAARMRRRMETLSLALSGDRGKRLRSRDLLDRSLDQLDHLIRMRNHRQVVRVDLDDDGAHALCEKALRVWRNGLVSLGDEVPRRNGLPGRLAH